MSKNETHCNNTNGVSNGEIARRLKDLEDRVETLEQDKQHLSRENEAKDERIGELEETVGELSQFIEELIGDDDRYDERSMRLESISKMAHSLRDDVEGVRERLDDVEGQSEASELTPTHMQELDTPLENVVELPETLVEDQLTENQQRARFVAKGIDQYTKSIPKGRYISTGDMRRVLSAGTDCNGHSQTVSRVVSILDDLGGEEVEIKERRGERRVIFHQDLVDRMLDRANGGGGSNAVVTG
jgi:DNA repair exonuclease SbcCD ATPase subunit